MIMAEKKQVSVAKLPFYLGNLLMIALAVAIAMKGDGSISMESILWCVLCVLVGTVIFAIPFLMDHQTHIRIKERENEDRARFQVKGIEYVITHMREMEAKIIEQASRNERAVMYMEAIIKRMDSYVGRIDGVKAKTPIDDSLAFEAEEAVAVHFKPIDDECAVGEPEIQLAEVSTYAAASNASAGQGEAAEIIITSSFDEDELGEYDQSLDEVETAKLVAQSERTVVIAKGLFGIGNKPFIRGEGSGLSWEKGLPMDFLGMGKWQWIPSESNEPVRFQIYKNDEMPALDGVQVLQPAEVKEIDLKF